MPLIFAKTGERNTIKKVGGKPEVKRRLEQLGMTPGQEVTVLSERSGNIIVTVKDSRIAISREMAQKIIV